MGRREIIASLVICGIGTGLAAVAGAVLVPNIPSANYVIAGGVILVLGSLFGVFELLRKAPKSSLPATASDIGFAVATAIKGDVIAIEHREFIPPEITPAVLNHKISGRTSLQIDALNNTYADKHMRVSGSVRQVSAIGTDISVLVAYTADERDEQIPLDPYMGNRTLVGFTFNKTWKDRLMALNIGDEITVVGKLTSLRLLSFDGVELEHIGRPIPMVLPPLKVEAIEKPKVKSRSRAKAINYEKPQ